MMTARTLREALLFTSLSSFGDVPIMRRRPYCMPLTQSEAAAKRKRRAKNKAARKARKTKR